MSFRKRKHPETPFRSMVPAGQDPTATWRSNVVVPRPNKAFFGRRTSRSRSNDSTMVISSSTTTTTTTARAKKPSKPNHNRRSDDAHETMDRNKKGSLLLAKRKGKHTTTNNNNNNKTVEPKQKKNRERIIVPLGNAPSNEACPNLSQAVVTSSSKQKKKKKKEKSNCFSLAVESDSRAPPRTNSIEEGGLEKEVAKNSETSFRGNNIGETDGNHHHHCDVSTLSSLRTCCPPQPLLPPSSNNNNNNNNNGAGKTKTCGEAAAAARKGIPPSRTGNPAKKRSFSEQLLLPRVISVVNNNNQPFRKHETDRTAVHRGDSIADATKEPAQLFGGGFDGEQQQQQQAKNQKRKAAAATTTTTTTTTPLSASSKTSIAVENKDKIPADEDAKKSMHSSSTILQGRQSILSLPHDFNREEPSTGKESFANRDRTTTTSITNGNDDESNDENYHHGCHNHKYNHGFSTRRKSATDTSSMVDPPSVSLLLLTRAGLFAHACENPATTTVLQRSETQARVMGLSPSGEFHKRCRNLDSPTGQGAYNNNEELLPSRSHHLTSKEAINNFHRGFDDDDDDDDDDESEHHRRDLFGRFEAGIENKTPTIRTDHRAAQKSNLRRNEIAIDNPIDPPNDAVVDAPIPNHDLRGKRKTAKKDGRDREKNRFTRIENHPSRHTSTTTTTTSISTRKKVIASALACQKPQTKSKLNTTDTKKHNSDDRIRGDSAKTGSLSFNNHTDRRKSAFARRNRNRNRYRNSSANPLRKRSTETVGNLRELKTMVKNARRLSVESLPNTNRKPPVPWSAKTLYQTPKASSSSRSDGRLVNDDDSSDWSAIWDNLSIDSIPPRVGDNGDDASANDVARSKEDCPTDKREKPRGNDHVRTKVFKHGKPHKLLEQPAILCPSPACRGSEWSKNAHGLEDCPIDDRPTTKDNSGDGISTLKHRNFKEPSEQPAVSHPPMPAFHGLESTRESSLATISNPLRKLSKCQSMFARARKLSILSYQQSIPLVLFLFYAYAVLWTVHSPNNPVLLRGSSVNSSSRINRIGFEKQKRILHHIRFSKNPNLSLLQSPKTPEAAIM